MPFETIPGTTTQYALLSFDSDGKERTDDPDGAGGLLSKAILARAAQDRPSHVLLFSHGWKGDIGAARDQYNRWIKAMLDLKADQQLLPPSFKPMWIGLHWPSLPFGDEELGASAFAADEGALSPDEQIAAFSERLGLGAEAEPLIRAVVMANQKDAAATELPADAAAAYVELARLAGQSAGTPGGAPGEDGAGFDPSFIFEQGNALDAGAAFDGGGLIGGILGPLRQLSYWTMKKRARSIGEGGMHRFVAALMNATAATAAAPASRFHLMGHSFGCIVVSSVVGGAKASDPLPRQIDSLALVQGAVSLWAYGDEVHGEATPGYFNPWIRRSAVRGPIIVTRSVHDRAVGSLYPWASAVALSDGSFAPANADDDPPLHGAIGAFGIRGLAGVDFRQMLDRDGVYGFQAGKIYNLESSKFIAKGGGVSGAHSDIDGPQVAHALWQAAAV